ncbi:hypothetical protein LIER_16196 [Lithospermum erythrorhizon]|uniref:Uncharacterized protein n=1 Tax=Lithospermum erythrorhizon TaxID=34254 RepID=A0AAV3Q5S9_LITER
MMHVSFKQSTFLESASLKHICCLNCQENIEIFAVLCPLASLSSKGLRIIMLICFDYGFEGPTKVHNFLAVC